MSLVQSRGRFLIRLGLLSLLASAGAAVGPSLATACGGTGCVFDGASADGSKVFFETTAPLVPSDTDTSLDLYERSGGTTTQVSTNTAGTANGAFSAFFRGASADGSKVFFETSEQLAASDTDTNQDLYARSGGTTTQVSTNTAGTANGAFSASFDGASADGSKVFFRTGEQLAASDTDTRLDLYERSGGTTTQLSTNTAGTANGAFDAGFDGASADGSKVFFDTGEQLAASDTDTNRDLYERSGGTTTQVSTNTAGTANGAFDAVFRGASADGSKVFLETDEQLAASDTDTSRDVYERSAGTTTLITTGNPPPPSNPTPTPNTPTTPTTSPTGQRAAALKKCKKKKRSARAKCKKKAKKLPV